MRNLFRTDTAFFIVAGISFLAATITAVRYFFTDNGTVAATSGGVVANGVVFLVIGLAVRKRESLRAAAQPPS